MIAYLENRDGNCNVRFKQAETHRRFFEMMSSSGIHVRSFRADCGSYSEDIVKVEWQQHWPHTAPTACLSPSDRSDGALHALLAFPPDR